jgi:hypothetical protein
VGLRPPLLLRTQKPTEGYDVVVKSKGGQDDVYMKLFADELAEILHPKDDAETRERSSTTPAVREPEP